MSLQVWRMLQKPLCGNQMNLATLRAIYQLLYTLLNNKPRKIQMILLHYLSHLQVKQLTILKDILSTLHFMFPQTKI